MTHLTTEDSYEVEFAEIRNVTHVIKWLAGPLLSDIAKSQTYNKREL